MKKKPFIITALALSLIVFSNLFLSKIRSDMNLTLNDILTTAIADSEYVRPLAQKPDGTYCCKNTQYTSCSVSVLCD